MNASSNQFTLGNSRALIRKGELNVHIYAFFARQISFEIDCFDTTERGNNNDNDRKGSFIFIFRQTYTLSFSEKN